MAGIKHSTVKNPYPTPPFRLLADDWNADHVLDDQTIEPAKLKSVDAPADGEAPCFNQAQNKFEWKTAAGVSKHTELTDKEVEGVIDHANLSVTMAKLVQEVQDLINGALQREGEPVANAMISDFYIIKETPVFRQYNPSTGKMLMHTLAEDSAAVWTDTATLYLSAAQLIQAISPILLPADPTEDLHAATKKYVDDVAALLANYLLLTGGVLTGSSSIYCDDPNFTLWDTLTDKSLQFVSSGGVGYLYTDADILQLLATNHIETTVPVALPADPTEDLHAATKKYVDDKHADIEKEIFLTPYGWSNFSQYNLDTYSVQYLPDASTKLAFFTMKVPDDFVSFVSLKAVWVSFAVNGNMRWRLAADYASASENFFEHSESSGFGQTATEGEYKTNVQTPSTPLQLPNLSKGDYIGIEFYRDGFHVLDTLDADVHLLGLLFTYVASR